jgi:hypothetical protein
VRSLPWNLPQRNSDLFQLRSSLYHGYCVAGLRFPDGEPLTARKGRLFVGHFSVALKWHCGGCL